MNSEEKDTFVFVLLSIDVLLQASGEAFHSELEKRGSYFEMLHILFGITCIKNN